MSPLLILGLVLLAVVVALSIWQRRAHTDHTVRRAAPSPPASTPGSAPGQTPTGPRRVRNELQFEDVRLGPLVFNDDRLWKGDSLEFDGIPILVEIQGDAQGPHPAARQMCVDAHADAKALCARGGELVAAELLRRRQATDDVEPYELAVDVEDGRAVGYLWYIAGDFDGEIGVSSRDGWRSLTLEVIE